MNQIVSVSSNTITIGEDTFDAPYKIDEFREGPDHLLLLVDVWSSRRRKTSDPDIDIDSISHNLVSIEYDGTVRWRISDPPDPVPADRYSDEMPKPYYHFLIDIHGQLTVRHTNTYRYELNARSGTLGESVPDNHIAIGDRTCHFPFPIRSVFEMDGKYVVFLAYRQPFEFDYTFDRDFEDREEVYCLDSMGNVLWARSDSYVNLALDGDQLWMEQHYRKGGRHRIDLETGEIAHSNY